MSSTSTMSTKHVHGELQAKLTKLLAKKFPGMTIEVGHCKTWGRTALTFRWAGFDDLLPEERFHRLFHNIPQEFYEKHLRGCVWHELGQDESIEDLSKLPRSEDLADREMPILRRLVKVGFFEDLAAELGEKPTAACGSDFSVARRILAAKKLPKTARRDALLVLMRNGALCDCEALFNAPLLRIKASR